MKNDRFSTSEVDQNISTKTIDIFHNCFHAHKSSQIEASCRSDDEHIHGYELAWTTHFGSLRHQLCHWTQVQRLCGYEQNESILPTVVSSHAQGCGRATHHLEQSSNHKRRNETLDTG